MDRRRRSARPGTVTIGALVASMGSYAFSGSETLFTILLGRMDLETEWGIIMFVTGLMQILSGLINHRLLMWASNTLVMLVCGWTYLLFALHGLFTPTINNCAILSIGALYTLVRDALDSKRCRVVARGYQF